MEPLSLQALAQEASRFDQLVGAMAGIDRFCSTLSWSLSAHEALMPPREGWCFGSESGLVALARGVDAQVGAYIQPLEGMWGFGCPFATGDVAALSEQFAEVVAARMGEWNLMLLGGMTVNSALCRSLQRALPQQLERYLAGPTLRRRASLLGGLDAFLGRRSKNHRRQLQRARKSVRAEGVGFERLSDFSSSREVEQAYARILAVESRSWKGSERVGIESGPMCEFYRRMTGRLGALGALRVVFAQRDGRDLAYHFGGVLGDTYRGLQQSFDQEYASLSIGAVTHLEMVDFVCAEGLSLYDLGQDIDYKRRWAEDVLETITLVLMH